MRQFDLEAELARLPEKPGVYIMHNSDDAVIYVGKAKILKNRVRQYFQSSKNHTPKVRAMVSNVAYFEYIITDSEIEALVLECNLIKKYRPKYNILLKDDKQYPYIKITINERYPRIMMTRTLRNDGAKYFGPYVGMSTVKNVISLASDIFHPPTCSKKFPQDIGKGRPCLNYHIKKCFAPCTGNVSETEYREIFYSMCDFIGGDHKKLIKELTENMNTASKNMQYEKAADLRDKITAIKKLDEKQKIVNSDHMTDMDVIACEKQNDNAFVEVFFVRVGRISRRENFRITGVSENTTNEITEDFIKQFYRDVEYVPPEILTDAEVYDKELISEWLSTKRGKKVSILTPKRGEKHKIVLMVLQNAKTAAENYLAIKQRYERENVVLTELKKVCGLEKIPERIESYDISNISGTNSVGAMVVYKDGRPYKKAYRLFDIKSVEGADDYKSMQEVVYRRIRHAYDEQTAIANGEMEEKDAKFLPLPDLMLIDGGMGHLKAVGEILEAMEADISAFGMVKDDRHRTKGLVSANGEIDLSPTGSVFKLITAIQDEVHRFAITNHRNKRKADMTESELDKIKGVGEKTRNLLLRSFGTIDNIKSATEEELVKNGVDKRTAKNIKEYFGA